MSEKLLHLLVGDGSKYCFGKTKIFFRAGQVSAQECVYTELSSSQ